MSRARGDSLLWFRLSGFHSTDGWKSIGRVFVLAVVLDVVYQIIAEHFVYPGEAITVAIVLALVPYLILRGLEVRTAIFVLDQGPIYKPSGSLIREAYSYSGASSGGRMI